MTEIVYRIEDDIDMQKVSLTPYKKPRLGEGNRFEMYAQVEHLGGMAQRAEVSITSPSWMPFSIASDEGTAIGGSNTAPAPLSYFTAGIAFCFLSHVAMYSRACKINIKKASVELRMKFCIVNNPGRMETEGLGGTSDGLEFHFVVESDEPQEKIKKVYDECINACVALQSIVKPVPFEPHLHLNGAILE